MTTLSLDFETASEIDLSKRGLDVYARHDSTRILLAAYALDDGPVRCWRRAEGEIMPRDLSEPLMDPEVRVSAWNSTFERYMLKYPMDLDLPLPRWIDPMVMAHTLSMPGSLASAGKIVGLPEAQQKQKRGRQLIQTFCKPQTRGEHVWKTHKTHPELWEEFVEYNINDVVAEREIRKRIERWTPPDHEWALWRLDQQINDRGYPVDLEFVSQATKAYKATQAMYLDMIADITGVANPNSIQQMNEWFRDHGYDGVNLRKETVEKYLKTIEDDSLLATVLRLRLKASSTSPKKFAAIERATGPDGRLRGTLQFAGAGRTWRWAGRITQFQNLPRPEKYLENPDAMASAVEDIRKADLDWLRICHDDPMAAIVSCIRPAIYAPPGRRLGIADLSSIENVILGWLAGCQRILDVFEKGRDPYLDFAEALYHQPYEELFEEYKAGDKEKRTVSKPAVLGAGYRLGGGELRKDGEKTGLWGYAENMGIELTQAQAKASVKTFRETYVEVPQFWYDLENAAKSIITGRSQRKTVGYLVFDRDGPFMRIRLPSGRYLFYVRPKILDRKTPWGETRPTITYEGLNDAKKWTRISTHGGKICENLCQAVARDVLAHGLVNTDAVGLEIVGHVHDEIIDEHDEDHDEESLNMLIECMTDRPAWGLDIPLNAAGFTSKFYRKD